MCCTLFNLHTTPSISQLHLCAMHCRRQHAADAPFRVMGASTVDVLTKRVVSRFDLPFPSFRAVLAQVGGVIAGSLPLFCLLTAMDMQPTYREGDLDIFVTQNCSSPQDTLCGYLVEQGYSVYRHVELAPPYNMASDDTAYHYSCNGLSTIITLHKSITSSSRKEGEEQDSSSTYIAVVQVRHIQYPSCAIMTFVIFLPSVALL